MDKNTKFEYLPNEIFFEIFDHLDAFEIFTGFTLLNKRMSSILQLIPLHLVISSNYSRRQVNFISSHLTFHAQQVISIQIYDKICAYSSIMNLLFYRHNFINLKSCTLIANTFSTQHENVIKRIKTLNKLVTSTNHASKSYGLYETDEQTLTPTMLMQQLSIRSIELNYISTYWKILNYISIPSNLVSFKLCISGFGLKTSVYSILSFVRLCHTIRYLSITVSNGNQFANIDIDLLLPRDPINEDNLVILPHIKYFNLDILSTWKSLSIGSILICMPNLMHFYFHIVIQKTNCPFSRNLLYADKWRTMLEYNAPHLSKFEFDIRIYTKKYVNWNIIIDRWICNNQSRGKLVI
ncbi:unnamed protein product [Rotaria sordida]|uniref:F-box domain-containing protein n=3 Tax=Rotaria sordida TaxID=392033 RepID=A0A815BZK6_9BILA|nr:unnamed protein product [Rotaria sordida]